MKPSYVHDPETNPKKARPPEKEKLKTVGKIILYSGKRLKGGGSGKVNP